MLVLLLILAAAGLLIHGAVVGSAVEVLVAGVLSLLALAIVLGDRWLRGRATGPAEPVETTADEPTAEVEQPSAQGDEVPETVPDDEDAASVVFVAGRTTFHAASCSTVTGKTVSSAERSQLETGGMTPCRRCLPAA